MTVTVMAAEEEAVADSAVEEAGKAAEEEVEVGVSGIYGPSVCTA